MARACISCRILGMRDSGVHRHLQWCDQLICNRTDISIANKEPTVPGSGSRGIGPAFGETLLCPAAAMSSTTGVLSIALSRRQDSPWKAHSRMIDLGRGIPVCIARVTRLVSCSSLHYTTEPRRNCIHTAILFVGRSGLAGSGRSAPMAAFPISWSAIPNAHPRCVGEHRFRWNRSYSGHAAQRQPASRADERRLSRARVQVSGQVLQARIDEQCYDGMPGP